MSIHSSKYVWDSNDILASHTKPTGKQHTGHKLLLFKAKQWHKQTNKHYRYSCTPTYRLQTLVLHHAFGNSAENKRFQEKGCGDVYIRRGYFRADNTADRKAVTLTALLPSRTLSVLHNKCNLNIIQRMSTNRPLSPYTGCDNDILIKMGTS
jgi:hypothetical protein